ncbi:MAG: serine hydrolase, partial [Microbacterium sp.]
DPLARTEADRGTLIISKTGTNATVRGDVGLVRGRSGDVAYAVIANGDMAAGDARDDALAFLRSVGDAIRHRLS